jgi:hypothetical protein
MKGMGDIAKTILFGMIFLVGLSFLLSQFYHPERGLLLAQTVFSSDLIPACSGFGTLSLSQIQYSSNDPKFGGKWWTLTISQNCIGQSAQAYQKLQADSTTSNQPVNIQTTMVSQTLEYPITPLYPDTYVWKFDYYYCNQWWNPFYDCSQECKNKAQNASAGTNFEFINTALLGSNQGICYWWLPQAIKGSIPNTPNVNWKIKVSVTGDKGSDSVELDSRTQKDALALDGKLYVYWQGNLVTGQSFPDTTNIMPVYYNKQWYTVARKDTYSLFNNARKCVYDYRAFSTWSKCLDDYNQEIQNWLSIKVPLSVPGSTTQTIRGDERGGTIVIDVTQRPYQYPVLTLKISADLVTIYQPIANVVLDSISVQPSQPSTSGSFVLGVRETSGVDGSFTYYIKSCSPDVVQPQSPSYYYSIKGGTSNTYYLPFTLRVTSTQSVTCTVCVKATGGSENCKQISFTALPPAQCLTEGQKTCSPDKTAVWICKDRSWVTYKTCSVSEYCDAAIYDCVASRQPAPQPQPEPTPTPFKIENWMWGALVGLLAFFLLGGASGLANKQYDKVGIAAIIGLIAFIIVYSVLEWWSGLAWWQKLLVSLGIIGGAGGIIYLLFTLGIFGTVIVAIISLLKKR